MIGARIQLFGRRAGLTRLVFFLGLCLCLLPTAMPGQAADGEEKAEPKDDATLQREAQSHESKRQFAQAVAAYDTLIKRHPDESVLWHRRGVAKFMAGDFAGSVEDFDVFLEKEPRQMPSHWQRGLSQYGAGLFKEGRAQFEAHQKVNSHDVENAAWHFICVARFEGVEAARKALIPIEGDQRVPMAEIHQLYAGEGSEEAVLEAARTKPGNKRNHLCYAHLYLALHEEALGHPEEALAHYKLAAVDYNQTHYMGETASVFYQSRSRLAAETKREEAEEKKPSSSESAPED